MKKWLTKDRFRRIEVLLFLILVGHIVLLASRSKGITTPFTWQYVVDNPLQERVSFAYMTFATVPLVYTTAVLVGLFCIMMLVKLRGFRSAAKADDKAGINRYRWYEFGVGGGLLAAFSAHVAGAYNPAILLSMVASGILFGMAGSRIEVDRAAKQPIPKQTTWTLILSAVIIWALLGQQIIAGLLHSSSIPEYVYGIAGATAAFWLLHAAFISFSRSRKAKPTITATMLKHRLLTFVVLAVIAWQVVVFAS